MALFAFALFHAAAIAYSRGAGLREFQPLSRYQDPLLLGTVAQLFAGLRLAQTQTRTARLMLIGWAGLVAVGLLNLSESHLTLKLPYKRTVDRDNLAAVRAFLTAPAEIRSEHEPKLAGLYFNPGEVRRVLEDPVLRPRLPVVLRTPTAADALTPPWIIREGRGFTWAGAAILVILAGWIHRRSASSRPGL